MVTDNKRAPGQWGIYTLTVLTFSTLIFCLRGREVIDTVQYSADSGTQHREKVKNTSGQPMGYYPAWCQRK